MHDPSLYGILVSLDIKALLMGSESAWTGIWQNLAFNALRNELLLVIYGTMCTYTCVKELPVSIQGRDPGCLRRNAIGISAFDAWGVLNPPIYSLRLHFSMVPVA